MARRAGDVDTPHTVVHRLSRRFIEPAQDILVLGLGIALLGLMLRTLIELFSELTLPGLEFREVIAEVLFVLVMIEMLRLLIVYLQEHRVAVDFMVELGIVSTLREFVLLGIVELSWTQILALSVFILALGVLLRFGDLRRFEPWSPQTARPARAAAPLDGVTGAHRSREDVTRAPARQ